MANKIGYREKGKHVVRIHVVPFGPEIKEIVLSKESVNKKEDEVVPINGTYFKIEMSHESDTCDITWKNGFKEGVPKNIVKKSEPIVISKLFIHYLLCLKSKIESKHDSTPLTEKELIKIKKSFRRSIDMSHALETVY